MGGWEGGRMEGWEGEGEGGEGGRMGGEGCKDGRVGGEGRVVWWENGRCVCVLYMYRISSYKSLPQINAGLVYMPGR